MPKNNQANYKQQMKLYISSVKETIKYNKNSINDCLADIKFYQRKIVRLKKAIKIDSDTLKRHKVKL